MAADGSLKFDTKVNTEGFDAGMSTLTKAVERLSGLVEDLSKKIEGGFSGAGNAATTAAKNIDKVAESAKKAKKETKSLEEQMEAITVEHHETSGPGGAEEPELPRTSELTGEYQQYGREVEQFVDDYVQNMGKADQSTNEFKQHIETLSKALKDMESKGMYFGDDEYDETFMKLSKVKQALADYKKEMLSPTPDAVSFPADSIQGQVDRLKKSIKEMEVQGKTFGDGLYDSTYQALNKAQARLSEYKKNLTSPNELMIVLDENTLQGKINSLKRQLEDLGLLGKTFGDETYDSTYAALSKAQADLANYKKGLSRPVEIPVRIDEDSFEGQKLKLSAKLAELEKKGITLGNPEYDSTYVALQKVIQAEREYKKSLLEADDGQKIVTKSAKKMKASMDKAGKSAKGARKNMSMLGMLGRSVLFSMVFRGISMISSAFKEGTGNLAQFSDEFNEDASKLVSANTKLKNSFATTAAPIADIMVPALVDLIDLLANATTWAGQLLAALSGKSTFVKAVDVEEDYGAALKDSNKELKEKEKINKKLAFSFDDLIQAEKQSEKNDYVGPTPDQMFETVEIENDIKDFADTVKNIFSDLFSPMKQSWLENGPEVHEAVHAALMNMKKLALDVGASFLQVWKNEGYGKKITDDLLITFANLAFTVANLCDQLDKAWTSGDLGVSIMRHLGDLVLEVTGFFREASDAIREWSAGLDFSPLLASFDGVLVSLRPIVSKIGDALLWLLKDILLPIAKWGIENGIPAAFDLISAALKALDSILEALKPLAIWLWEDFLQPIGAWTGKVVIEALKKITEWLTKFSDWVSDHEEEIRFATVTIAGFFAAWKAIEFVEKMKNIIDIVSGAGGFIGVLELLNKNLDLTKLAYLGMAAAIGILIGAVYEMFKNWDNMTVPEKVISSIMAAASAAAILAVALGAVSGGAAKAAMIAGAIALGIGAALVAVNAGKRTMASAGSNSSYSPYSAYGMGDVSSYRLPRLATGTVVPPRAGEFAAILGDNNRETEIVSPLSTIEQALDNVMAKYMGEGGNRRPMQIDLIINGQRFARAVYEANNQEKQRVGVRMVTEG